MKLKKPSGLPLWLLLGSSLANVQQVIFCPPRASQPASSFWQLKCWGRFPETKGLPVGCCFSTKPFPWAAVQAFITLALALCSSAEMLLYRESVQVSQSPLVNNPIFMRLVLGSNISQVLWISFCLHSNIPYAQLRIINSIFVMLKM